MQYSPELYTAVTSTLYAFFGSVGSVIQVAAVVFAGWRAWLVRYTPTFRLALIGFLLLALSLILWGALVAPVNAEWARVIASAPDAVPDVYARLRPRWEYGHVAAFSAWLVGFLFLLGSVVAETPRAAGRE